MVIYVELVFLENFAVDYFLLLMAGKITYQQCKHPILSSIFGAIYACVLPAWSGFDSALSKFACLIAMTVICFGIRKLTAIIHSTASMFILAGSLFGIINLFFAPMIENGIFYNDSFLFIIALCSIIFSASLYRILIPVMQRSRVKESIGVLKIFDREISCLIDTGNSLYYGDTPVILVEKEALEVAKREKIKPLIIPYASVGGDGALMGFKPKNALLTFNGETMEINCVIALCEKGFCKNFSALAHPDLIKEKLC